MTARFSFTPPSRQLSIWQTPIAAGLQQLLEHHPIRAVLAGGDPDRRDAARDRRVAEDVVRERRLFDPPEVVAASALTRSIASSTSQR